MEGAEVSARLVCERPRCHSPAKVVTLRETFKRGGVRGGPVTLRITRQLLCRPLAVGGASVIGERLELVKAWGELRTGMVVIVKRTVCCGKTARFMLLNFCRDTFGDPLNGITDHEGFNAEPDCCGASGGGLTPSAVAERRVFRLVDDDLTDVSRPVARKLERVR